MSPIPYTHGLHEIAGGIFAWLQPDGSWGWSNAGLVTAPGTDRPGREGALLVDTLYDLALTGQMLDAMRRVTSAPIKTVVNTHANGDHCYGNQLVRGAEIVASARAAAEMRHMPPAKMAALMKAARLVDALGPVGRTLGGVLGRLGLGQASAFVDASPFVRRIFGAFAFDRIELTPPTRTFSGTLDLVAGGRRIRLLEVGPAHTAGDVLVHLPDDKVLFSGDILFIEGHPILWNGPVRNAVDACDAILAMDLDVIVPGHGPLTDKAGVERVKRYWQHLEREARQRFAAGMSAADAARDIPLGEFASWRDAARMVINVDTIYRELRGDTRPAPPVPLFGAMARYEAERRR